jgi:peptidoglycan/LPS O-acetylase OafA/YrhL
MRDQSAKPSVTARFDVAGAPGRYAALDALRALAIVLVLLRHWIVEAQTRFGFNSSNPFTVLAQNGWIGVDLFFVLSGFLIASHFIGPHAVPLSRPAVADFYWRRVLRTMPLYWGVIILCWLLVPWSGAAPFSMSSFQTHYLFLQDYRSSDVVRTLWSLAVEEKFYLLAPLLMLMLVRLGRWRAAGLLLFCIGAMLLSMVQASAAQAGLPHNYYFWLVRAPFHHAALSILAGVLVALLHGAGKLPVVAHRWPWWALCAGLAVLHSVVDWNATRDWRMVSALIVLSSALFAALVAVSLSLNETRPDFGSARPLRHIARLSYALYLVHFQLLPGAVAATAQLIETLGPLSPTASSLLFLLVYLALAWTCALLLHLAIERPFLRLRERYGPQHNKSGDVQMTTLLQQS